MASRSVGSKFDSDSVINWAPESDFFFFFVFLGLSFFSQKMCIYKSKTSVLAAGCTTVGCPDFDQTVVYFV